MKTIAVMLGIILALALFTREFNWRVRGLLFAALLAMTIVLIR
jgi:hypothetical protein